jgi:hypothetical protein
MNQQSQVEVFWDKIKLQFGDTRSWNELNPMEQSTFIQGVNYILSVFNKGN